MVVLGLALAGSQAGVARSVSVKTLFFLLFGGRQGD